MPDGDTSIFTITDLKQFLYCQRILYFHRNLPDIRPTTYKMIKGIQVHETEQKRSLRRTMNIPNIEHAERVFDINLYSEKYGLSGQLDELIIIENNYYPVDYKFAQKSGKHFEVQLTAYAMLLEEVYNVSIEFGYLYLLQVRKTLEVSISSKLRKTVLRAIDEMHNIAKKESFPEANEWKQRCLDCEFRRLCNDV